jgi:hypothetical protein
MRTPNFPEGLTFGDRLPHSWWYGLFPTGIDRQRVEVQELREHKTAQTTMIYPDALNRVGRGTVPLHQLLKHVSDETQEIMRTHRTA